jgi:anti-sigma B factor antagonist
MPQAAALRSPGPASPGPASLYAPPPPFACSWRVGGWGAAWVQVAGELDLVTSPQFRQTLGEAQRSVRLVVLDLRELSFIDSSGVYVILDVARDARRGGGRLLIVRGPAQIDQVLKLTNVCEQALIFDLAPTEPAPSLLHPGSPATAA